MLVDCEDPLLWRFVGRASGESGDKGFSGAHRTISTRYDDLSTNSQPIEGLDSLSLDQVIPNHSGGAGGRRKPVEHR